MDHRTKQRMCVVCRKGDAKQSLLRIVRHPEGGVDFDATGRSNGRGAYVCSLACYQKAAKSGRLDGALRTKLTDQDYERIGRQMVDTLCPGQE